MANAGYLGAPATYAPGPNLAAAPVAYSPAPAVSTISYSSPLVSYGAQAPAITSQSSNILRSFGNLGQVSTYSKTVDTPFSSVSKSDVRVSNPGLKVAAAPISYAAPAYAAPAYAAPAYAAPAYAAPAPAAIGVAYSAAPAVAHVTYSNGYGISYGW